MFEIASIHKVFRRPTTNVAFCLASLCSMTAIATEAPTGFDNKTNGFIKDQAEFDKDRETFEEVETIDDGLGPVYNGDQLRQLPPKSGVRQFQSDPGNSCGPSRAGSKSSGADNFRRTSRRFARTPTSD